MRSVRSLSSKQEPYLLPDLPYEYNALEPFISAEIMQLHHSKHHAAYVSNLNKAMEQLTEAIEKQDLTKIVVLQKAIKFNAGGHLNHSMFWKNLAPQGKGGGDLQTSELSALIECQYGSLHELQRVMSDTCNSIQGSGWAWLAYDKFTKSLAVAYTKNQTPLPAKTTLTPLLGIDVWEHAFYPQVSNCFHLHFPFLATVLY